MADSKHAPAHHDLGGAAEFMCDPVDIVPHELTEFDREVDALRATLAAKNLMTTDEVRRGIEAIPEPEYLRLSYVNQSWQMFPVGFLFGLGFDTVTEVSLLTVAATEASKGLPVWSILAFPALFSAGMSLIHTTDGILMLGAYGWAFVKPIRKLYYNLTITIVSAVVAILIGGIETLGLIAEELNHPGMVLGSHERPEQQLRHTWLQHHRVLYCCLAGFVHCLSGQESR